MNFNKLTSYLDSIETQFGIPFSDCAVTYHHDTVFRHMTGHFDANRQHPTNIAVMYRLFSGTKLFTCVAALQLIERGKLHFFDLLQDYLPEFSAMRVASNYRLNQIPVKWPNASCSVRLAHHPIRIIDLMTMTAGFSYDTHAESIQTMQRETKRSASTREAMSALAKMPLLYEPGTRWSYSLAHDVLAAVVEVVSEKKFSTYLREHIFAPLEADDFCFHPSSDQQSRVGHLYFKDTKTGSVVEGNSRYSSPFVLTDTYESGGAGILATVDTFSKVVDALSCDGEGFNGTRILQPETVKLLTVPYIHGIAQQDFEFFRRGQKEYHYGLGVRVRTSCQNGHPPLGEFEWDGAAGAYFAVDCENHLSIVYAQHMMNCLDAFDSIHPTIRDLVYEGMEL